MSKADRSRNGFNGYLFKRNETPRVAFTGFGPGSGSSIRGRAYANIDADPFANHATDITLDMTPVNANGFLQNSIVRPQPNGNDYAHFCGSDRERLLARCDEGRATYRCLA
jgi:hypothetical protein